MQNPESDFLETAAELAERGFPEYLGATIAQQLRTYHGLPDLRVHQMALALDVVKHLTGVK